MYFSTNGGAVAAAAVVGDGVDDGDAVVDQAAVDHLHDVAVILRADVLHHADRRRRGRTCR